VLLSKQYQRLVGENYRGKKQCIALIRTLFKKASILILDETASDFDWRNEYLL
jgi:ABC-type multidrug transport system fused ATPase/permease subunit